MGFKDIGTKLLMTLFALQGVAYAGEGFSPKAKNIETLIQYAKTQGEEFQKPFEMGDEVLGVQNGYRCVLPNGNIIEFGYVKLDDMIEVASNLYVSSSMGKFNDFKADGKFVDSIDWAIALENCGITCDSWNSPQRAKTFYRYIKSLGESVDIIENNY